VKTISLKKVAVVAVASLGFGLLSVVPANAAVTTARTIFVDDSGGTTYNDASQIVYGAIGVAVTVDIGITTVTAADAAETISVTPSVVSKPAASSLTVGQAGTAKVGMITTGFDNTAAMATTAADSKWTLATSAGVNTLAFNATTGPALSAKRLGDLSLTADVAGTYVIDVTPSSTTGSGTNTKATVTFYIADLYATTADGLSSGKQDKLTANGVAGPYNTVTLTFTPTASASRLLSVSGAGATITSVAAPTGGSATVATDKLTAVVADDGTVNEVAVVIATPTAGTVTVNAFAPSQGGIYSTTPYGTVTITVGAAALNGTLSVANSTSILDASSPASWSTITADETALASANATTVTNNNSEEVAMIKVVLKDTLTNLMPDGTVVSATISGPGNLNIGTSEPTAALGRAVSVATTGSAGAAFIGVYRDGTAGKATVTITVGTTTIATETVTFYGAAASYTATVAKKHIASSGSSTAGVITVAVKDKDGNAVPSSVVYASVGTSTIASIDSSATSDSTGVATFAATGLVGKFGSVPVTFSNATTAATVSTSATFGVSSIVAASVVAAADKTTYAAGAPITWTLTFKDSNGLGLPDGTYTAGDLLASSAANPVASAALASTPFVGNVNLALVAGVATATGYAPLTGGPVSYTWTLRGTAGDAASTNLAAALQGTKVSASATVTDATFGLITQIDALNAKIVALNALIAKIMKKLGVK